MARPAPRTRVPLPPPAQVAGENLNSAASVSTSKSEKRPIYQGARKGKPNTGGKSSTRPNPNK